MIRRLTENDREMCFEYVSGKPAENLFIIGDIEAYGFDTAFQKLWGDFDSGGSLNGVLLKYERNYIPFSYGEFDAAGFAEIMKADPEWKILSGLGEVTEKIEPYLSGEEKKRLFYYAKCDRLTGKGTFEKVKKASPSEAEKIIELYGHIEEFSTNENVESRRRNMEKGVARTYYIEEDGKMVSSASTGAENTLSAMVVGVCTLDAYKRRGYASQCMLNLCTDLLQEGRELCLFYDNPEAGAIYKRIGFKDIGMWTMYEREAR
ncbi:GNAT family N-acetyltransferase [Bacillus mangrovi]|uniref:GNAT family N-acetyltransferase n=1 Tax=Metabacillus mangrovi TaxID=1491830 RepID=A0A7X2S8J3_9BACI|nr:GNAT family N-acetyltransferase [Metabacillus mangrovi]MTH55669.1 GNAT family N-acetyltransferase [Metabacillus mangrovi]